MHKPTTSKWDLWQWALMTALNLKTKHFHYLSAGGAPMYNTKMGTSSTTMANIYYSSKIKSGISIQKSY